MRKVTLNKNSKVTPCKCGNNTKFDAYSRQCGEDCCEVWVECSECGHDPTADNPLSRFEDVWGGTHNGNVLVALDCWNDAILEKKD